MPVDTSLSGLNRGLSGVNRGSVTDAVRNVVAVDIGGTKAEVGVVTIRGEIVHRVRVSTSDPVPTSSDDLFARIEDACRDVSRWMVEHQMQPPVVVGVGCGGPMAPLGETVSPLNLTTWRGFPLRGRLAAVFGKLPGRPPVHVDNDAKALALGEGWIGAAAGTDNFMAMVVSTGVGGGIVLDGRLLDGATGNAGHIGHVVVNPGGREHAGIRGTVEGEASGTAIADYIGSPAQTANHEWRTRTGTLVGRAVGSVANLLDLKLVVVAGSVALGYGDDFFAAAQREVDAVARLDHSTGTRVIPAGLGGDGPLVGAAAVGLRGIGMTIGVIKPR